MQIPSQTPISVCFQKGYLLSYKYICDSVSKYYTTSQVTEASAKAVIRPTVFGCIVDVQPSFSMADAKKM